MKYQYSVSLSIFENSVELIQQNTFEYNSNFKNEYCFEFILYIWRNSKQGHISHTPLLLDNDTNKEWQDKH